MKHLLSIFVTVPNEGTAQVRKLYRMFRAMTAGMDGLSIPIWKRLGEYFSQP